MGVEGEREAAPVGPVGPVGPAAAFGKSIRST